MFVSVVTDALEYLSLRCVCGPAIRAIRSQLKLLISIVANTDNMESEKTKVDSEGVLSGGTEDAEDNNMFRNPVVDYVKHTSHVEDMTGPATTRVFVIYCGGTIGMKKDPVEGYRPVKGYLSSYLKGSNRFHDQEYLDSIGHEGGRPFGINTMDESLGDILVLPTSIYGKRVAYQIHEYKALKDSCNVTSSDWIGFARNIEEQYHNYDAFVILHGTDTMAYTASALSFLLENLGKTVIITGSQVPFSELRNDAHENFLGALTLAGHYVIPEVTIFFDNRLIRGNRSRKVNAVDFAAFDSPNLKPLAELGTSIDIDWSRILRPSHKPFRAWKVLGDHVGCFRLFPGISADAIRALTAPPMRGVVLESFGTGNAPDDRPDLLDAIREACERGVVIVNVTQCTKGTAGQFYATGHAISEAGVVSGIDMTAECALTKLNYLLSHDEYDTATVKRLITVPLRGELTVPTSYHGIHPVGDTVLAKMINDVLLACPDANRAAVESIMRPLMVHQAAAEGDMESLRELCTSGLNMNHGDYENRTFLFPAIRNGHVEAVEWLLKEGVSIHMRDVYGYTPVSACIVGSLALCVHPPGKGMSWLLMEETLDCNTL